MAGRYAGTRTTNTYAFLYEGARRAIEKAEAEQEGQFYEVLNTLVLSAFTIEAYLNHLVDKVSDFAPHLILQKDLGQKSVWVKYKILRQACNLGSGGLEAQYPALAEALQFRNKMAHGRTETIHFNENIDADEPPCSTTIASPEWQSFAVLSNAQLVFNQMKEMVTELHKAAGIGSFPFNLLGTGLFSFELRSEPTNQ